jgi:hypothetical protein
MYLSQNDRGQIIIPGCFKSVDYVEQPLYLGLNGTDGFTYVILKRVRHLGQSLSASLRHVRSFSLRPGDNAHIHRIRQHPNPISRIESTDQHHQCQGIGMPKLEGSFQVVAQLLVGLGEGNEGS